MVLRIRKFAQVLNLQICYIVFSSRWSLQRLYLPQTKAATNKKEKEKMKKTILAVAIASLGVLASCGNNGAFDSSKSISITVREDGSGTKSAFLEILGLKGAADPTGAVTASSTAAVLTEVSSNQYALGYDSLGYVTDAVKKVKVDNVEATSSTIKDGTYALSRPLNVIYKASEVSGNEIYSDYLTYLQTKEVEDMASSAGYVAVHDSTSTYNTTKALSGKIAISGSTSLQPLMLKIAAKYMEHQPGVKVEVSGGGSGTGYSNAEKGVSAFGMISETFNSTKASSCTYYTVCKDGIALIANLKNPIENISKANLATIFNPNAESPITKWSQLIA